MKGAIKRLVNRVLHPMGFELSRRQKLAATPGASSDFLETVMTGIIESRDRTNIIQIGANDGKHGDPIHDLVMAHRDRTNLLLVEPQPELIRHLEDAYRNHPSVSIFTGAVGPERILTLFRIHPEYWTHCHPPFLENAPDYRAPSGVTSADRSHVERFAEKHLAERLSVDEAIERIDVPCRSLPDLLSETGFPRRIDLLQIDVEGADDEVIYSCDIDRLLPTVINFETRHLGEARKEKVEAFLSDRHYTIYEWNALDALALRLAEKDGAH